MPSFGLSGSELRTGPNGGAFGVSEGHDAITDLFRSSNDFEHNEAYYSWQRNELSADKNRQWQEEMSNTAMQRSVADYEKAGFSSLAALQGGGASTPSGSSGSASPAHAAAGTGASGMLGVVNAVANAIGLGLNTSIGLKNAAASAKNADAHLISANAMDRRTAAYEKYFNNKIMENSSSTSTGFDRTEAVLGKKDAADYEDLVSRSLFDDDLSKDEWERLNRYDKRLGN